jgi:cation diffusion facilitator CzcD-associated flavoprotein CzcO
VERPSQGQLAVYDAIVIGAGISGMYMLYRLRELGMTVRVFGAGRRDQHQFPRLSAAL